MARTRCLMRRDACAHHRSSAPTFREYRRAVSGSYRNEEWIEPPCKQIHLDETEGASSSTLYPEIYKSSSRRLVERSDFVDTFPEVGSHMTTQVEEKIAISFSDTAELISPHTPREPLDSWYTPADQHRFLHEVSARAATTRRMMEYASRNEASYNSATGLTAPHVLREYLANPEEVVGVEYLLDGQGGARTGLIRHHRNVLADAQDPRPLSERLEDTSTMSAHLARERASYSLLI